jgi:hypothetical protein
MGSMTGDRLRLDQATIVGLVLGWPDPPDGTLLKDVGVVGYPLHKIYAKLGITSRAELSRLDLDDDAAH